MVNLSDSCEKLRYGVVWVWEPMSNAKNNCKMSLLCVRDPVLSDELYCNYFNFWRTV